MLRWLLLMLKGIAFCGNVHNRNIRSAACNNCSKIGGYSKACKSKPRESLMTTIHVLTLCTITATILESISQAVTDVFINKHKLNVLLVIGSSESFTNDKIVSRPHLKIKLLNRELSMVLTNVKLVDFVLWN